MEESRGINGWEGEAGREGEGKGEGEGEGEEEGQVVEIRELQSKGGVKL